MAVNTAAATIQIVNTDLAVERQRVLRERLREIFASLSDEKKLRKEVQYVQNQDRSGVDKVAAVNPQADAIFTGFHYDTSTTDEIQKEMFVDSAEDILKISPALRYPLISDFEHLAERGFLRHRQLILVGEVEERLRAAIRASLPVEVSYFVNEERSEVSQRLRLAAPEAIVPHRKGAVSTPEQVVVSHIDSLSIGGVEFQGIVNMPERKNRFLLEDPTLEETARKLFTMVGMKEVIQRESLHEEKMTFVRAKKVFIVMEPDLEHVVSGRLAFDKMERLYRHHSLPDALAALENGATQGLLEYFNSSGFDVLFEVFSQEERDRLMLTLAGERLGGYLEREISSQKSNLMALEEGEVKKIWNNLPDAALNELLEELYQKSAEKYLAMVPLKIRESVMEGFLVDSQQVVAAWEAMGGIEKKEILATQEAEILAQCYLVDTPLFQQKFPALKFEFGQKYSSATYAKMDDAKRRATYDLLLKGIRQAKPAPGIVASQLSDQEQALMMGGYVPANPEKFLAALSPLGRKNLWHQVGGKFHTQIATGLHILDKVEILAGNREAALEILFGSPDFSAFLKAGENIGLAGTIFLNLKKNNKTESKTAFLRKLLEARGGETERNRQMLAFFAAPENAEAAAKVAGRVEEDFHFSFDSLICSRADYEQLREKEPLQAAVVTFLDDLVDGSLFNLFQRDNLSQEDYDAFTDEVEEKITALKRKMMAQQEQDPVSVYLLETMNMLNEMSNQALRGTLTTEAVAKIDERHEVRLRMVETLKGHVEKIEIYLAKAGEQEAALAGKIAKAEAMAVEQGKKAEQAREAAKKISEEFRLFLAGRKKIIEDKTKVALTQKDLSLRLFHIIQPLVLKKLGGRESFLKRLFGRRTDSGPTRIIFKFSNAQIENILRHKIVFCSRDEILVQFLLTCLRIDGLQDSLFTIATPKTLPKGKIDILFHGPGYEPKDFKGLVKRKNIVPFADSAFFQRLTENEELKKVTKAALVRTEKELAQKKPPAEQAVGMARTHQEKMGRILDALEKLKAEQGSLGEKKRQQDERRLHAQGELDLLETRFAEVDGKFNFIRETLEGVAETGGETLSLLSSGRESLGKELQGELQALNKELARMMYIKGVKDAGDQISKGAQEKILARIEQREQLPASALPLRKVVIADDGSNPATNLKRAFGLVVTPYFKLREGAVEEISLKRLESRVEDSQQEPYPFVAMMAGHENGKVGELKELVKKIRRSMPEAYLMVFAPLGEIWNLDRSNPDYQNIQVLKDQCCLVNSAIADYTDSVNLLRLLSEKAPR